MMCWEATNNFTEEEPHKEPEKVEKKPVKKNEKLKHEEEHVEPILNTGNRLKISIEEFSWEREDDGSTLDMEEFRTTTISVHHEPQEWFTRGWYGIV